MTKRTMRRNGHSTLTKEDMYYDGNIDGKYEDYCEETGEIIDNVVSDGWDSYEGLAEEEYDDVEWDE